MDKVFDYLKNILQPKNKFKKKSAINKNYSFLFTILVWNVILCVKNTIHIYYKYKLFLIF